jgi:hypothetical protein
VRRTIWHSLLVAVLAGTLVAAGASATAIGASKCTRAESTLRVSKKQLTRDAAALRYAQAQLRGHPGSAAAKRNVARAKLRVRADNRALTNHKQKYEQDCLPGY